MSRFAIGQTVWVSQNGHRGRGPNDLSEAVVTKVGRKWVTIKRGWSEERFDPVTGDLDGGNYMSPGRVWADPAEWKHDKALVTAWTIFVDSTRRLYSRPNHLTLEGIRQMQAILSGAPTGSEPASTGTSGPDSAPVKNEGADNV